MNALRLAFSRYEKACRMLSKLDTLKHAAEIDESTYTKYKSEYEDLVYRARENLQTVRAGIKRELAEVDVEMKSLDDQISSLQLRIRVGELSMEAARRQISDMSSRRDEMKTKSLELSRLRKARSSSEVGGFIDVDVQKEVSATSSVANSLDAYAKTVEHESNPTDFSVPIAIPLGLSEGESNLANAEDDLYAFSNQVAQRSYSQSATHLSSAPTMTCPSCNSTDFCAIEVFNRKHPEVQRIKIDGGMTRGCVGWLVIILLCMTLWPVLLAMGVVGGLGLAGLGILLAKIWPLVAVVAVILIVFLSRKKAAMPRFICEKCGYRWR